MKICILGAGFVSSGVVHFLCRENFQNVYSIVVGSKVPEELQSLFNKYPFITTVELDVTTDVDRLHDLIIDSSLVISLLTNDMQVPIAKACIKEKVNMVHASYCTKQILELDTLAKQNGVIILNEIGLDPGIDHFLAMKAIDEIRAKDDSRITAFISYCGGLPEPSISRSNPLRYKFSWSPRTALGNMLNGAKYLENGKLIEIPAGGALIDTISDSDLFPELELEGYPNRDSLIYKYLYDIQEADTIIRGTLRYKGYRKVIKALYKLGLLGSEALLKTNSQGIDRYSEDAPKTWKELVMKLVQGKENISNDVGDVNIRTCLLLHGFDLDEINALEDLGLLSDENEDNGLKLCDSLLDTLSEHLLPRLSYGAGERDMVVMKHIFKSITKESHEETREIDFIAYGDQGVGGFSAMTKTVSLAIGHAVKLLLNGMLPRNSYGSIKRSGVIYPFTKDIYEPILEGLAAEGFVFDEKKMLK